MSFPNSKLFSFKPVAITVTFTSSFTSDDIADGDYDAKFWFADDDIEQYPAAQISLPITIGSGGNECANLGDLNNDGLVNVIDVVLLVNVILLGADPGDCSDINGDGVHNVIDVVLLVNIILG